MITSVVTESFVIAGLGAFYLLAKRYSEHGALFIRTGAIAGLTAILRSCSTSPSRLTGERFVRSVPKLFAIPKEVWINKPPENKTQ